MSAANVSPAELDDFKLKAIAEEFLSRESMILDERRFDDWFTMLDDAIEYEVPIRIAMRDYADEFPAGAYRIFDVKAHIKTRIARLKSDHAWAEVPPSRTLRVVGSLLVERTGQHDVISVVSAMIVYRQRGHDEKGDIIPVRRFDLLRLTEQGPRLLKRKAIITEGVLNTPNLGIFL
jgi:3-phenylpropionate/cinnamic acid dioxygenase small subunit